MSDYRLNGSKIANSDNVLLDQSLTKLRGLHNAENLMAAIAVAKIHGFENKEILDSIMDYKAPAHRCELVLDSNGIQFINDSKATNLHAVASALNSFRGQNIVLIAGGKIKGSHIRILIQRSMLVFHLQCSLEKIDSKFQRNGKRKQIVFLLKI